MCAIRILYCLVLVVQWAAGQSFQAQVIDSKVGVGYGLAIGDVDGDKKPDILLVDRQRTFWYRNPDWSKRELTGRLTQRDHVCIAAQDIDGDGKVDVAVGGQWNPGETTDSKKSGSVHVLGRPADDSKHWTTQQLPHDPTVHRMRWIHFGAGGHALVVVPLHGRGNRGGKGDGVKITAHFRKGGTWVTDVLDDTLHMTHNFDVVSWYEDYGDELLVASREGVFLLDPGATKWKRRRLVDDAHGGAGEVRLGRFPSGERFVAVVEPMHGPRATVYRLRDGKPPLRTVLADDLSQGHALACADVLGLGRDQVVVGWRGRNQAKEVGVRLYVPDATGDAWTMHWIDRNGMACEDLRVADLNGDRKPDVIAAGRDTHNLKIYWNRR